MPAIVCRVPDVPRTNNGKKVEMACMNLLRGRPVANRGSIANAGVVDATTGRLLFAERDGADAAGGLPRL